VGPRRAPGSGTDAGGRAAPVKRDHVVPARSGVEGDRLPDEASRAGDGDPHQVLRRRRRRAWRRARRDVDDEGVPRSHARRQLRRAHPSGGTSRKACSLTRPKSPMSTGASASVLPTLRARSVRASPARRARVPAPTTPRVVHRPPRISLLACFPSSVSASDHPRAVLSAERPAVNQRRDPLLGEIGVVLPRHLASPFAPYAARTRPAVSGVVHHRHHGGPARRQRRAGQRRLSPHHALQHGLDLELRRPLLQQLSRSMLTASLQKAVHADHVRRHTRQRLRLEQHVGVAGVGQRAGALLVLHAGAATRRPSCRTRPYRSRSRGRAGSPCSRRARSKPHRFPSGARCALAHPA